MNEWDARLLAIANKAVREAQDENRRKGIPNVYVLNGTLVWQLPDGSITTTDPMRRRSGYECPKILTPKDALEVEYD